ncbi:MAG: acyl-CoA dehydrogenase family protein [Elusimicrobia bacterium]|nr:acyl-CoA dehydrogenase family protein [Elusimicrobiota bacterium]
MPVLSKESRITKTKALKPSEFIPTLCAALERELARLNEYNDKEEFPWDSVKALAPLGAWGMLFPKKYGGLGLGHVEYTKALEEFGRIDSSLALTAESHNSLCGSTILRFGNEEQRKKYLPKMARGMMGAWALTEPEAGSDAKSLKTKAELKNDSWVLNGSKTFTTQGSVAGVYVIFASTTPGAEGRGISAFVAEPGPGLTIGKTEKKMGLRASDTAQLHLVDLKLPKENLLGDLNRGFPIAMQILEAGRVAISGVSIGMARGAIEWTLKETMRRGGDEARGRSLRKRWAGENPGLTATQKIIAQHTAKLHAVRMLTHYAAQLIDEGKPFSFYASLAKLLSGELAMQAATEMLDILGDEARFMDNHVTKLFRDAKLYQIGEGTSEIQAMLIYRHLSSNLDLLLKP